MVYLYSTIKMMHGPINIRFTFITVYNSNHHTWVIVFVYDGNYPHSEEFRPNAENKYADKLITL